MINKRQKTSDSSKIISNAVKQAVLEQFYPRVLTLREYLLSTLPKESKIRRRKVATAGTSRHQTPNGSSSIGDEEAVRIANVLGTTLVGIPNVKADSAERGNRWNAHVATQMETSELTFLGDSAPSAQSEVSGFRGDIPIVLILTPRRLSTSWSGSCMPKMPNPEPG